MKQLHKYWYLIKASILWKVKQSNVGKTEHTNKKLEGRTPIFMYVSLVQEKNGFLLLAPIWSSLQIFISMHKHCHSTSNMNSGTISNFLFWKLKCTSLCLPWPISYIVFQVVILVSIGGLSRRLWLRRSRTVRALAQVSLICIEEAHYITSLSSLVKLVA